MMLFLFSSTSFAQVTAHATAMADIVTPINLTWEADLNFANVAVQAAVAGTVKLLPMASPATRQATAGCTLPVNTGTTPTAAQFSVQGEATYTYSITLPTTNTIKNQTGTGGETMIVNTFTSSPTPTGLLGPGGRTSFVFNCRASADSGNTSGSNV